MKKIWKFENYKQIEENLKIRNFKKKFIQNLFIKTEVEIMVRWCFHIRIWFYKVARIVSPESSLVPTTPTKFASGDANMVAEKSKRTKIHQFKWIFGPNVPHSSKYFKLHVTFHALTNRSTPAIIRHQKLMYPKSLSLSHSIINRTREFLAFRVKKSSETQLPVHFPKRKSWS